MRVDTRTKRVRSDTRDRSGRTKSASKKKTKWIAAVDRIIGVDGEGQGRSPHLYTYLAGSDEKGRTWSVENVTGLTTVQCLEFFMRLPDRALIIGFAFQYDLTKILHNLPDDSLYDLFHEERRAVRVGKRVTYTPIEFEGFSLNFMNRRLTVKQGKYTATVWDIFRFFQSSFTSALRDWKIAPDAVIDAMQSMKEKRAEFDKLPWHEVKAYCKGECLYLSHLGRALIEAHKEAGLELKHYYGAGSTASAFLETVDVKDKRGEIPEEMREAVASAFFGGRFEISCIGEIRQTVYNYDISSAYPYQAYLLPCLQHGKWTKAKRPSESEIKGSDLALIHWSVSDYDNSNAWGAFPTRTDKGTIIFPLGARGGWTWKAEFLAGRELQPNAKALEAWLYHTSCLCHPFKDIPTYYRERLRLGKEAKGIVIKLGLNSIYGKLAQSIGLAPPYQSWVWAGNITSGTRAQLLESIARAENPWNVLMVATDGIYSTERLRLLPPKNTGTDDTPKPLGGWEETIYETGIFVARPGIYFPNDLPEKPTEKQIKAVRARGLGKKVLYEQWRVIKDAYESGEAKTKISTITRFVGAKTGLSRGELSGVKRSENYGEWIPYPISMSFSPLPKRRAIVDGKLIPFGYADWDSVPYERAMGAEEENFNLSKMIAEEQPEGCFIDV